MIAIATEADVEGLVALHHRIFDSNTHYAIHLGEQFICSVMRWYCQPPGQFTLLARKEGRIVGYVCLNLGSYNAVFWRNGFPAMKAVLRKPSMLLARPILRRLRGLLSVSFSRRVRRAGAGYLALIAVAPGAGVPHLGTALVKAALAEAKGRGWKRISTATRCDNLAAQGLFRRTGFARVSEADSDNLVAYEISLKAWNSNEPGPPS